MKASELRALDVEALRAKIREWEEARFRQRCERKLGQLENTNLIRETRRNIARALTILREKEREHGASQRSE
jgi:large subunit ribosomal protein L29